MRKNVFSQCPTCFYSEYLGLGEVGCFDDNPPCMRETIKDINQCSFKDNENINPNDIAYNNIHKENL